MKNESKNHVKHRDEEIAYHVEWGFRREALRWKLDFPVGPNLYPLAGEFRKWLLGKGQFGVFTEEDRCASDSYTNPYTYHASALISILANIINDAHSIVTSTDQADPMEVEIARVRNYNEQVLYIARVCESLTKQLLYCTQIPLKNYKRASLGQLLSTECRGCRASGQQKHKLSYLGSLAHRYKLCGKFEQCLRQHMKIVGRRRNIDAAHSDTPTLNIRSTEESREQLNTDTIELGNEFVHMLEHISEIEDNMIREIETAVESHFIEKLKEISSTTI